MEFEDLAFACSVECNPTILCMTVPGVSPLCSDAPGRFTQPRRGPNITIDCFIDQIHESVKCIGSDEEQQQTSMERERNRQRKQQMIWKDKARHL